MDDLHAIKPTALIIDDEQQIRRLLRACLEANDYRVVEAATGADGISEAAQRPPERHHPGPRPARHGRLDRP